MIYVYPSTLPGEPLEQHSHGATTVEAWLAANVPGYAPRDEPPISIKLDGELLPPEQWASTTITAAQRVEIRPQPGDPGTMLIAAIVASVVAVAATLLLKPSIPNQSSKQSKGSSIYEVSAQGNRPKLGDVIPEIAGTHKHYPDYLSAPRRYFSGPKEQSLDVLLCVTKGSCEIAPENLRISETPIASLGSSANAQLFEPGEDVSSHQAHRRWYNAPEVGATAGGSGIKLMSTRDIEQNWDAALSLSGNSISGADQPQGWGEDLVLRLIFDQPVTVTREDPADETSDNIYEADISWLVPSNSLELLVVTDPDTGYQRRIAGYDSGAGTFKLQYYDGTNWVSTNNIAPGSYSWRFTRWPDGYESYRITAVNSGSFDLVLQLSGSDVGGWSGFPAGTSNVQLDVDLSFAEGIWSNAFLACPRNETVTHIEWDVFAPQGLGFVNDDGDVEERGRWIELEYREASTDDAWTLVANNITGRTRDQLGWTFTHTLPSAMTPEVRLRRVEPEDNDVQALDKLEWYGLRSELPGAKTSYPGVTVLALTLTGSSTIANQTENQINVIATRKLPEPDGTGGWAAPQPTRSIAAWMAYVAKSVGYTDDDLDLDELNRLHGVWDSRGDVFDFVHDDSSTVRDTLQRTLRAGMAELTLDSGKLSPRRDEPRTDFEQMYSAQNMLEPLRRAAKAPRPDDPDGVDVEYFSAESWTDETVECRLPGDAGFQPEKVRLEGVTDRTRAWRIGMRRRRELKYRRWEYDFSTELDALNSSYMSYCALADDVPGYGQSSLLELAQDEGSQYRLHVSEPMEWQAGESHVVAWRRPDGTLAGPFPATQGEDEFEILATHGGEPMPSDNRQQELPHVLFGTTERWSYPVLIQEINPQGFESVSVKAINYDVRIYADDDNSPQA